MSVRITLTYTLTRRPQFRQLQSSYSFLGQPPDSLWNTKTSGAAKAVSSSQRSAVLGRISTRHALPPHRLQGGPFSSRRAAPTVADLSKVTYRRSSMSWWSMRAVAPQMRCPSYEKAGTRTSRPSCCRSSSSIFPSSNR